MPIKFSCPQCKNVMTVDSKFAGKKGKCNKCGGVVLVPAQPSAAQANTGSPAQLAGPASVAKGSPNARTGQPAAGASRPAGPPGSGAPRPASSAASPTMSNQQVAPALMNMAPPPSTAGLKVSGPLGHVMEELTESDFNRASPYQNVYAPPPPKPEHENEMLMKAYQAEDGEKGPTYGKDGRPKLTGTLLVFGVLDILEAVLVFGMAIALAFLGLVIPDDVVDKIPFMSAGIAVLILVTGFTATFMMASGLGILTKQIWGYSIAVFVYSFQLGFRLITLIGNITDVAKIGGPIFGLICMLVCTAYFWKPECRVVYGVSRKSKLPLIVGGIGFGVSFLFGLLLFLLGAFA